MLKKLLYFASVAEIGTGLVLVVSPAMVVTLLLSADLSGVGIALGMSFGIALLALGLACWPRGPNAQAGSPAFLGMLVYKGFVAILLVDLFPVGHYAGGWLWSASALHPVVGLIIARIRLDYRRPGNT